MPIRPRPNSSGQGLSDSTQSACEDVKLSPVALQLLALRLDHLDGRIRNEAFVGEQALGARDLLLQSLDLDGGIAVRANALRPDHGLEDPPLVAVERDEHATPPEDRGGGLHALERLSL